MTKTKSGVFNCKHCIRVGRVNAADGFYSAMFNKIMLATSVPKVISLWNHDLGHGLLNKKQPAAALLSIPWVMTSRSTEPDSDG